MVAKLRYIGSTPVEVICNGHPKGGNLGVVEPDQVLEVDDEVYASQVWPESRWVEVEGPGAKKKPAGSKLKDEASDE